VIKQRRAAGDDNVGEEYMSLIDIYMVHGSTNEFRNGLAILRAGIICVLYVVLKYEQNKT
jgi:hypothetical protein